MMRPMLPASLRLRFGTLWFKIAVTILCIALLKGTLEMVLRLLYELEGAYTGDSTMYWAMGRGILNGLVPYIDLYENKPPGIFLVSAASIFLTGGPYLGNILQALILAIIPVLFAAFTWMHLSKRTFQFRIIVTGAALLTGMLFTLFLAERSGEFQVESFGAFFGILYAFLIAGPEFRRKETKTALLALCIFLAVGFKEPFLLSLGAVGLILSNHPKEFLRNFLIPLAIAAAVGVFSLVILGYWKPYADIYLQLIFSRHLDNYGPWWQRGLEFRRVFRDLNAFAEPLGWIVLFLVTLSAFFPDRGKRNIPGRIFCIAKIAAAVTLLTTGIGLGGEFWNHHFAIGLPGYVAFFIVAIHPLAKSGYKWREWACGVIALLSASGISEVPRHYQDRLNFLLPEAAAAQAEANQIDRILDACGVERYLFFGSNGPQPYAFTKHSPEGPFFATFGPPNDYSFSPELPVLRNAFLETLHKARIAVVGQYLLSDLTEYTRLYVEERFTEEPWECARSHLGQSRYRILFRKR